MIVLVALTRFIPPPPTEFSIMAMAAIIVSFSLLLKDLGTSSAIIQKEQLDEKMINAVYSLHLVLGFTFAFFIIFLSPFVASYFNEKQLIPVLILLAFSFPIASFGTIHLALLERNARFMQIACIELSTNLLALIVTVITAYCHFGVYSLVAFMLVYTVISTVLLCSQSRWRLIAKVLFKLNSIKSALGYSSNLTVFNLINYFPEVQMK